MSMDGVFHLQFGLVYNSLRYDGIVLDRDKPAADLYNILLKFDGSCSHNNNHSHHNIPLPLLLLHSFHEPMADCYCYNNNLAVGNCSHVDWSLRLDKTACNHCSILPCCNNCLGRLNKGWWAKSHWGCWSWPVNGVEENRYRPIHSLQIPVWPFSC